MILTGLFILFLTYLISVFYKKWKVYTYLLNHFKTPPLHPIYGNFHLFPSTPNGIFEVFQSFRKKYGKNYVLVRPIIDPGVIVGDINDAETILSNPNTKSAKKAIFYKTLEPWLGTGLLTAYGEKWFARRKIITPSFHFSILDRFIDVMNKQSNVLIKHLKTKLGEGEFDIYPMINAFALDVICETSMGVSVDAQSNPHSEYVTSVKKISQAIMRRMHHPLGIYKIYDFTSQGKYLKELIKILHDFTDKVIRERRDQILTNQREATESRMHFLDILLHASVNGSPLSNEDIREEVDTFMFEGHDTTASGISFTLYLLAKHPDVQEKVYREVIEILGSKNEIDITSKKLSDLKYLEMVIKESLRIFPSVPAVGRQLTEDTEIGGVLVPAGVEVRIPIYGIHHNPEYYPEPEKFDPERFNAESEENRKTFAFIPFSAGGRNCIGQKFALLDLKICVAKVVMNFKLLPGPEVVLRSDLILKATDGIVISLVER